MIAMLRAGLLTIIGWCGAGLAPAGTFDISPLRINLSAQIPISVLKVNNKGDGTSVMQVKLMAWSQSNGEDHYDPTNDVLATPPIFTLEPGAGQIIRIGLRRAPDVRRELAYRLFLQEVPIPAVAPADIKVALRFGIPVFVAPLDKMAGVQLDWRIVTTESGAVRVEALNRGGIHVQLSGFTLKRSIDGAMLAERKGMDYLLPAQGRHWLLNVKQMPAPHSGGITEASNTVTISARTDAGNFDAEAALER